MEKKPKLRLRLAVLYIFELAVLVGPLLTVLILNRARYFTTVADTVKVSIGGVLCLIFLALMVFGKLHVSSGLFGTGAVFVLSWLLDAILQDLFLLSGMAFAGKVLDSIFFMPRARNLREQIRIGKTADAAATETVKQLEGVLQKYIGRV